MIPPQLSRLLLIAFLCFCSFSEALAQQKTESRVFHASVTDEKGTPFLGLKQENFLAWVDKEPLKITSVGVAKSPATVGLLFDASTSIAPGGQRELNTFWRKISATVKRFMEACNQENDYFAVVFDGKVSMTKSWTGADASLLGTLTVPGKPEGTALYDALYHGLQNANNGVHSRRVVVILSDGQDNNSKRTFKEVREFIKKSDVTLYAIGIVPNPEDGSALGIEGQGVLDELTSVSGGRAWFIDQRAKPEDLNAAFDLLAAELQNQYQVSVERQSLTGPDKWRKLRVKLELPKENGRPKLYIRTRDGYYQ